MSIIVGKLPLLFEHLRRIRGNTHLNIFRYSQKPTLTWDPLSRWIYPVRKPLRDYCADERVAQPDRQLTQRARLCLLQDRGTLCQLCPPRKSLSFPTTTHSPSGTDTPSTKVQEFQSPLTVGTFPCSTSWHMRGWNASISVVCDAGRKTMPWHSSVETEK